jgi:hypothetical protein
MLPVALLLLLNFAHPLAGQFASDHFVSADVCSDCHSRLYPPGVEPNWSGMTIVHRGEAPSPIDPRSIAPFALWRASMMALSAADPYWQAKLRFETAQTPAAAKAIEDKCLSCHAPMQQYETRAGGGLQFAALNAVGAQGVSCTVCHQIDPANLGKPVSFSAGFEINTRREIYGPHRNPFPMPMRMHTGRTPTFSAHMLDSALCGACHTLLTPTLDAAGNQTGEFLEQATYLEWASSSYPKQGKSCQSCHLPRLEDPEGRPARQYIAHTPHGGYFGPIRPREPFGQHPFGSANVQMLGLLAARDPARSVILGAAADRGRRLLASGLTLELEAARQAESVEALVHLRNTAGHKFPSGFPSRRLWLHLTVRDSGGAVRFESGAWNPETGEIRSLEARGAGLEPHHARITNPAETQIYEVELADAAGAPTVSLLRAGKVLKDNRLLPAGFVDGAGVPPEMRRFRLAPAGTGDDESFGPGGDTVLYRIPVQPEQGPWMIEVEALYQSIKPSHTRVFDSQASEEEAAFLQAFTPRHRAPVVVGRASAEVR